MNSRIRTNRISYRVEKAKVDSNYEFFVIETSEKYIKGGALILDAPSVNRDIKSIIFESGRKALVMMQRKDGNRNILKNHILSIEGGEKLSLLTMRVDSIPDYQLLQLLLNALSSYDSNILKFNNLTGHLYCFHPEWAKRGKEKTEDIIWKIPCLEFVITKDYYMAMSVRTFTSERLKKKITFTKKKFEDYPKYVLSKDNTMRRRLPAEAMQGYILRQIDGTKSEISFLDFQNEKKFEQCKVGTMLKVLNAFNEKYKGIANIECDYVQTLERIDYQKKAAREDGNRIRELLECEGVHLVDLIGDEYSEQFVRDMQSIIAEKYGVSVSAGKRVKKDNLNICVIHNAEYYAGIQDPHSKNYDDVAVQHVTLEDFAGNAEFAIATVINEVLIKRDLLKNRISLFDWTKLGFNEDMSFGAEYCIDNTVKYYFMNVHPDGSFEMKEQEFNLFEMNEYSDCVNVFEDGKTQGKTIKGIIRNANGQINIIEDTGIITIPEVEEIDQLLKSGDTKLRGKERREELLSSCLDIKLYEEGGKQYYFVGTIGEGMRWKIPRAANVRCIESYKDAPLMFTQLLPTMSVSFVHNGQLTVIPFPFKYLREYVKIIE